MPTDAFAIQSTVANIIEEMLDELDLEYDQPIDSGTRLIANLGFASIDFVHLIVELEGRFQRKMGFHDLIMPEGKYVDDLTVGQFVRFIDTRLNTNGTSSESTPNSPKVRPAQKGIAPSLQPRDLADFRALIPSTEKWWGGHLSAPREKKNPRVAFVLSSSRSGSTLLRVILAGNPQLFAPPELHLLYYATMSQRHQALANQRNEHLLSGAIRAVMQLRSCEVEQATALLQSYEERQMPIHDFYGILQEMLGRRLLVDKTPTYAISLDVLERAERHFDSPLFIHLVRHPCGMIRSFEDGKLEQLTPFMRESHFTRRQLAELTWLVTNQNIVAFFATVPPGRWMRVRYENLVREPESSVRDICEFLSVPFAEEMLDPYRDLDSRMTGGVHSVSQFSGDLKFHLHARIEPEAADRWRKYDSEDSLSAMSRSLAASFGY
jgi:acyl carrier protein